MVINLIIPVYRHIRSYHIKEPCSICGKMIGKGKAKEHLQFKHNIDRPENKYKCEYCGKCFIAPSKLRDHENTHTGLRPHMCKNCGMCFSNSGAFSNHMKMCTKTQRMTLIE